MAARRTFMTFETTTSLDSWGNFFDSAETEILSTAFAKAWAFVEFGRAQLMSAIGGKVDIDQCTK